MIYSLKGVLLHAEPGMAVVECGGVGFRCFTTANAPAVLPRAGEQAMLFTHMIVKEDALDLYGFVDLNEISCFRLLISVSGVGPKVALGMLSLLSPDDVSLCVVSGDVKTLTRCPNVGPKLAQRIILELKDKLGAGAAFFPSVVSDVPAGAGVALSPRAETINALVALGYSQSQAAGAVAGLDAGVPVEEQIKYALKRLAGRG